MHSLERLEEPDVLGEVGKDPELELSAAQREQHGEDDVLDDPQGDDEDEEPGGGDGQVVDALAHDGRPQREQADGDDAEDDGGAADPVVPGDRIVQPDEGVVRVEEDLVQVHVEADLALLPLVRLVGGLGGLALAAFAGPWSVFLVALGVRLLLLVLALPERVISLVKKSKHRISIGPRSIFRLYTQKELR